MTESQILCHYYLTVLLTDLCTTVKARRWHHNQCHYDDYCLNVFTSGYMYYYENLMMVSQTDYVIIA